MYHSREQVEPIALIAISEPGKCRMPLTQVQPIAFGVVGRNGATSDLLPESLAHVRATLTLLNEV